MFCFSYFVLNRWSFQNGPILLRLQGLRSWLLMTLTGTMSELVSFLCFILCISWSRVLIYELNFRANIFDQFVDENSNVLFCAAASIARKIYLRGGLGVGAFQRIYGGSQRNGSRPPHFCKSSGSIARHILQQLQNMNLIEMDTKG